MENATTRLIPVTFPSYEIGLLRTTGGAPKECLKNPSRIGPLPEMRSGLLNSLQPGPPAPPTSSPRSPRMCRARRRPIRNLFATKRLFERPLRTPVARSEDEVVGSRLGSRGRCWRSLHSNSVGFFQRGRSQRHKPSWGQNPKVNVRWKHRDYHLRFDLDPRAASSSPLPLQTQNPTSSPAPSAGTAAPVRPELLNHTAGNADPSVARRIGLHVVCHRVDHNARSARVE